MKNMRDRWPVETKDILGSQHQKSLNITEGLLTLVFTTAIGALIIWIW